MREKHNQVKERTGGHSVGGTKEIHKYIECFKKESVVSFAKCSTQILRDKD